MTSARARKRTRFSGLRHRTALAVALGASAASLVALPARAQERQDPIGGQPKRFSSPQHFAGEIRVGLFTPRIDTDPALGGATPYKDVFGSAPRVSIGAELDWQVLRIPHLGSIGPGIGVGFASISDPAHFLQPHGASGTTTSGETATLTIYPIYVAAVLRADALWRDVHVPLVPYAKLGVAASLWRASNTLGTSHAGGVVGEGTSLGGHIAFGLALCLNPFDPYAATTFDDAMGVNGTYLYAEWTREDTSGLWIQKDPLRVGGNAWTFGLAFEF